MFSWAYSSGARPLSVVFVFSAVLDIWGCPSTVLLSVTKTLFTITDYIVRIRIQIVAKGWGEWTLTSTLTSVFDIGSLSLLISWSIM
ncbi:hypothetical protein BDW62DRAFT_82112 [Aspergillus aurantiobrunneus]